LSSTAEPPVRLEIVSTTGFADDSLIADQEVSVICSLKRGVDTTAQELFRTGTWTRAATGSSIPAWNLEQEIKEFGTEDVLRFTLVVGDEEICDCDLPRSDLGDITGRGVESSLDMVGFRDGHDTCQINIRINQEDSQTNPKAPPRSHHVKADSLGSETAGTGTASTSGDKKAALLMARLLPCDVNQKVACAVHITKNHKDFFEEKAIAENPSHHTVIATSANSHGLSKNESYQVASEVGCVCKLIPGENEDCEGEPVHVIPSLETRGSHGKFMLQLLSTEDILVERVN